MIDRRGSYRAYTPNQFPLGRVAHCWFGRPPPIQCIPGVTPHVRDPVSGAGLRARARDYRSKMIYAHSPRRVFVFEILLTRYA